MKHTEREPVSVPEQEGPNPWWRLRQWLGFLISTSQREASEMRNERRDRQPEPSDVTPDSPDATMVRAAVNQALSQRATRMEEQAGGVTSRLAPPLEIGAQRDCDPEVWGPNYRLRGAPIGEENSPQQIAAMKAVPLTADKRYLRSVRFLAELDNTP